MQSADELFPAKTKHALMSNFKNNDLLGRTVPIHSSSKVMHPVFRSNVRIWELLKVQPQSSTLIGGAASAEYVMTMTSNGTTSSSQRRTVKLKWFSLAHFCSFLQKCERCFCEAE